MKIFNILICDDSKVQRQITKQTILKYLSQYQTSMYEVADGEEALKKLKEKKIIFDLVFLDLEMPKITGIEILKLLEGKEYSFLNISLSQIIVLSTEPKKLQSSISSQLLHSIKKPIVPVKFAEEIRNVFDGFNEKKIVKKEVEEKLDYIYETTLDLINQTAHERKTSTPQEIKRIVLSKLLVNDEFLYHFKN